MPSSEFHRRKAPSEQQWWPRGRRAVPAPLGEHGCGSSSQVTAACLKICKLGLCPMHAPTKCQEESFALGSVSDRISGFRQVRGIFLQRCDEFFPTDGKPNGCECVRDHKPDMGNAWPNYITQHSEINPSWLGPQPPEEGGSYPPSIQADLKGSSPPLPGKGRLFPA